MKSATANFGIVFIFGFLIGMIDIVVKSSAFRSALSRTDNKPGEYREVAKFDNISPYGILSIEFVNLGEEEIQETFRGFESVIRTDYTDIVPHQASKLLADMTHNYPFLPVEYT